ncbi:bifunctional DNA primase/polymerase [Streptomyces violaceusniger]|uniref:bifunctional DNA primase/polymerase n=1 Tax=Streptomyces violaceusniger TaxID=68280 RepID=UPI0037F23398
MTSTERLGPYALQAWARGFHVFPVEPYEKTPHTLYPGQPYTLRWSEAATNELDRVTEYWKRWPNANIGIACKPSSLLVVDCDMPKRAYQLRGSRYAELHDRLGPLVDGTDVFRHICESLGQDWAESTRTYRVCTGSMGCHYYYSWPDTMRPPRAPEPSQASIVKGLVDVRSGGGERGGYVLGNGSVTTKGPYWAENDRPIRVAPPWLVALCRDGVEPFRAAPAVPFRRPGRTGNLSGLVATVEGATRGNRNQALLWAARSACADGTPVEHAIGALSGAYTAVGGDGGARQAEQTIRSAYRLQGRKA